LFRQALTLCLGVTLASEAFTQMETAPPSSQRQIHVVTSEVIVPVTVTNESSEFVLDLSQREFRVLDDGLEQTINQWDLGGDPLAIALVLETNSRPHAMISAVHSLGSIFTETAMALDGEAALITYDSTVDVRQSFTQDHDAVERAIGNAKFEAPERMLYDAMAKAVEMLKAETMRRRIMLVVGDPATTGALRS
jgi:VWFA-related protein